MLSEHGRATRPWSTSHSPALRKRGATRRRLCRGGRCPCTDTTVGRAAACATPSRQEIRQRPIPEGADSPRTGSGWRRTPVGSVATWRADGGAAVRGGRSAKCPPSRHRQRWREVEVDAAAAEHLDPVRTSLVDEVDGAADDVHRDVCRFGTCALAGDEVSGVDRLALGAAAVEAQASRTWSLT